MVEIQTLLKLLGNLDIDKQSFINKPMKRVFSIGFLAIRKVPGLKLFIYYFKGIFGKIAKFVPDARRGHSRKFIPSKKTFNLFPFTSFAQ